MNKGEDSAERCGVVALLGATNAGKSTLLNRIVGAKVSIVTPRVQTTRTRIMGIVAVGASQLVFIDTPGIFTPRRRLDRSMVGAAWQGAADANVVAVLIDARAGLRQASRQIIDRLSKGRRKSAVCILNKIDLVRRDRLLPLIDELRTTGIFGDFFMVSAATGDGVDDLKRELAGRMPVGPWLFPPDQLSDMNDRLFAAELTREKLFLQLRDELPYHVTVETDSWDSFANGSVRLRQTIYVERETHKGIVLGRGGALVKGIRERVQRELMEMLDCEVHLFLFVKVRRNWIDDPERYRDWGLDFPPDPE